MLVQLSEPTAALRRVLFYLVDDTDGKTPETGVTLSAGDLKLSKNGAAEANHAGTWTELAGGRYYYEATAPELDTLGYLSLALIKTGIRTFVKEVQVENRGTIKRNTAQPAFPFLMTDSTNHAPAAGLTVSVTRSIDGGAFAAGALSAVTAIGSGLYKVDFAAADLNGKFILLRATATGADDALEMLITYN